MRRQKEVSAAVLARAGRYHQVADNLEVKEVRVGAKRYVVCRNPQEAARDAAARKVILEKLREKLAKQGAKAMVGNKGFARFLKMAKGSVEIADPLAGALTLDKTLAKRVVRDHCLPTAPFVVLEDAGQAHGIPLPLPLFVKPVA